MFILLKHIFRNIRENKFRSVLVIVSLAISTMVMFLNLTIKDDIVKKYTTVLQGAYQSYDLSVRYNKPNGIGYFKPEEVDLSSVNPEQVLYNIDAFGVYLNNEESITVRFMGFDRQKVQDTNLCDLEEKSEDFSAEANDQIIVSKKTADKFEWNLNDEITFYTQAGEKKLKITGIAKTTGIYLAEFDNVFLMTTINFAGLCEGQENNISEVIIDLPKNTDLKAALTQLEEANEGYRAWILVDEESVEDSLNTINQLLIIILSLVIGLNFYIIASITKLMMATRLPVVGTFRSLGATKGKMNFILILENAVYGVIGAAIGIVLGIFVRNPISDIFISMGDAAEYINIKLDFKMSYVLISVGFSIGLQILISLSSILKSSKRSIKDSIFNTLKTQARLSMKKTIFGLVFFLTSVIIFILNTRYNFILCLLAFLFSVAGTVFIIPILTHYLSKLLSKVFGKLFGGPANLGMKNISSSKTIRSSITLITVGLALILMVNGAVESLNNMFSSYVETEKYDIMLTGLSKDALDYQYIEDIEGVDKVTVNFSDYIEGKLNGKDKSFILLGANRFYGGVEGDESLATNLSDDDILIDEYYALLNKIEVGDEIVIESSKFSSNTKNYKVAGFMNSMKYTSRRNLLIINESEFKKELGTIPSYIEINTSQSPDVLKEQLIKELAGTGIRISTLSEYIQRQKDSNQEIINMVTVILALSILLAIFGLINNQLIGFIQRKREYAVLYSVSMSRSQLRKMIFFESLGTFLTGCIYAILLGIWLMKLLYSMLMSIGMGYKIDIKIADLLTIVGIVLIILLTTSIPPIRKISKINVVNEIKYE